MRGRVTNLTGERFGKLVVIQRVSNDSDGHAKWECLCECGKTTIARGQNLIKGTVKSCGCLNAALASDRCKRKNTTHGGRKSRLYSIWIGMHNCCTRPYVKGYKNYGGRGIRVCAEWHDFATFRDWALSHGYKDGLTIDRIDSNGNYEPDNCRWITLSENIRRRKCI